MTKLAVEFTNETTVSVDSTPLKAQLEKILARLGKVGDFVVELKITDEKTIHGLNQRYLNHDYPTDVLSFPSPTGLVMSEIEGPAPLGGIVICVSVAQKQAKAAGISLDDELKVLASHGLLHLLGYHHH